MGQVTIYRLVAGLSASEASPGSAEIRGKWRGFCIDGTELGQLSGVRSRRDRREQLLSFNGSEAARPHGRERAVYRQLCGQRHTAGAPVSVSDPVLRYRKGAPESSISRHGRRGCRGHHPLLRLSEAFQFHREPAGIAFCLCGGWSFLGIC